jgi:hypothetical protein
VNVVIILFSLTIFVSALLLFLIQPLTAKMVLPFLGGTPAVWNTSLFFFQSVLLGGYAYAHIVTRKLSPSSQAIIQLFLLIFSFLVLPIDINEETFQLVDRDSVPFIWLLGCLATTIGMPFFMLSTNGPLLQRWFSQTSHASARDPYFLYASSNLGSLLALVGYPILIEPNLGLSRQSRLWSWCYAGLTALILTCAINLWKLKTRSHGEATRHDLSVYSEEEEGVVLAGPLSIQRRLRWIAFAFAPASLMYGVTTYLTTDLASVPLLWILPLSIYLLTFILTFSRRRLLPQRLLDGLMPLAAIVLIFLMLTKLHRPIWLLGALHLVFLFIGSMVCHARLANDRPASKHLTEFYLWVSLGGALGGLFNSLIAPIVFNSIIEYPFAIVLALSLRRNPARAESGRRPISRLDFILPAVLGLLTAGLALILPRLGVPSMIAIVITLVVPLLISYAWARRPLRFAMAIGWIMIGSIFFQGLYYGRILHTQRTFFGVLRVSLDHTGTVNQLFHGNTAHGRQFIDPGRQCEPLSYYHRRGPLGEIFEVFNSQPSSTAVAVIGLGAGTTACYTRPGQQWFFYEIDPDVIGIARNNRYFTYLSNCARTPVQIIPGDARVQIRNAAGSSYGLIVLDAFSSDVIPTHLLTRQALDLYLSKLADKGLLALHTSNQYLDLQPVIADLVEDAGLVGFVRSDLGPFSSEEDEGKDASQWTIIARREEDLADLISNQQWQRLKKRPGIQAWTDDYSNIIRVFKWR